MVNLPTNYPRFGEIKSTIAVTLRFPSGGLAQFFARFGTAEADSSHVIGSQGEMEMDPGYKFGLATKPRLRVGGQATETAFPRIDQFGAQTAYFSDCIATGTRPEADDQEGLTAKTGLPQSIATPTAPSDR